MRNATIKHLIETLFCNDPQKIIEAVNEIVLRNEKTASSQLLQVLRTTNDSIVRNAIALALTDWKDPDVFDVILDLLRDERTKNNRGTLLYAIGDYDCSHILPLLVDMVIEGNFEVSRQALSLIFNIETEISEQSWNSYKERIQIALESVSNENRPILIELLSLFEKGE